MEEERKLWQNRVLDSVYPIVYFDALVVKVRQDGRVIAVVNPAEICSNNYVLSLLFESPLILLLALKKAEAYGKHPDLSLPPALLKLWV